MSTIVLVGATGATGRKILHEALASDHIQKVTAVVRRPLEGVTSPKLNQLIVEDFNKLNETSPDAWAGDIVINALGT